MRVLRQRLMDLTFKAENVVDSHLQELLNVQYLEQYMNS